MGDNAFCSIQSAIMLSVYTLNCGCTNIKISFQFYFTELLVMILQLDGHYEILHREKDLSLPN